MGVETQKRLGERFLTKLKETNLNIGNLGIQGGKVPGSINIHYYQGGLLERAEGQFFVSLPDELSKLLPGTYISPDRFLEELTYIKEDSVKLKMKLLGSDYPESIADELALKYQESGFSLNIFGGLTNAHALSLTELAKKGFKDDLNRIKYQNELSEIIKSVLTHQSDPSDPPAIRIVEDCIASGDTIVGVLTALNQKTKLNEIGKVRIDVAVATAQGILLLRKFAQDNGIDLEINAGYMAFGLSKGSKTPGKGLEHSNYITYPAGLLNELDNLWSGGDLGYAIEERVGMKTSPSKPHSSSVQVVGDMGDGGKKPVSKEYDTIAYTPWYQEIPIPDIKDGSFPTFIYLANGGYLMRGYVHYFLGDQASDYSELIFSAKRRFDEGEDGMNGGGYGVLLYDMPENLFE